MGWNDEQRQAIELRGKNMLVAAAAGSGKTTVMVERIQRLVCEEKVPVSELLVVTFTNAAAAEMKEKIRKALEKSRREAVMSGDEAQQSYLRVQLSDLDEALICTFHSFALHVIRRFFYLIDIEPGFGICDEAKAELLKEDALDELLEEEFEKMTPHFRTFLNEYSGDRKADKIRDLILDADSHLEAMPYPREWTKNSLELLRVKEEDFAASALWLQMKAVIKESLEHAVEEKNAAGGVLVDRGLDYLAESLFAEAVTVYEALDIDPEGMEPQDYLDLLSAKLDTMKSARLTAKKEDKEIYEEIKGAVKSFRDASSKELKELKEDFLAPRISDYLADMEAMADRVEILLELVDAYRALYEEKKREERVIDFSDIEHYALEILESKDASAFYRDKFTYIFIDEYQDTNLIQEAIIGKVRRENNLFMVGDIKQSIYKFRLAEPSIFQEKYDSYSDGVEENSVVIDLNKNYRSKGMILRGINTIFAKIMEGYDDRAALHDGLEYKGPYNYGPELHVIFKSEEESGVESEGNGAETTDSEESLSAEELKSIEIEALAAAGLIRDNLGTPYFDSKRGEERELTLSDIVILLRSTKTAALTYRDQLERVGIPCIVQENGGYFDITEVAIFVNLLNVIDNKRQDVALISVLHSEIFGFSAEELGYIRMASPKGSFHKALLAASADDTNEVLACRCKDVLAQLDAWSELSQVMPLSKFVWKVMVDSNFYLSVGSLPGGAQKQANLRILVENATAFENDRQASLYGFIRYIERVREKNLKVPEAKMGETVNAVRIMTIHKSKGLEFPMVIVGRMGARLNYTESKSGMSFHKDLGIAFSRVNYEEHWKRKTLPQKLISKKLHKEQEEEEIRILYVALTRAQNKLFMLGSGGKLDAIDKKVASGAWSTKSYLDMVLCNYSYHLLDESYAVKKATKDLVKESDENLDYREQKHYQGSVTSEEKERLLEILNYRYPFAEEEEMKSKYSVSELNQEEGEAHLRLRTEAPPFIRGEEKLSGAARGTLYHELMEKLDFARAGEEGLSYINQMAENLVEKGYFSEEERKAVRPSDIADFFASDLGRRAAKAAKEGNLYKERPFTMRVEEAGQEILVQGTIDCFFTEESGTILLDYKSNYVPESQDFTVTESYFVEKYGTQIALYRKALEEGGAGPVTEAYLYLLTAGQIVEVTI